MTPIPLNVIRELTMIYAEIPAVACKGKCQSSCCPVGNIIAPVERQRIEAKAGYAMNEFGPGFHGESCNMLSPTGLCMVYTIRPAVCRLYGTDEGMACPHGCQPLIADGEGKKIIGRVNRLK